MKNKLTCCALASLLFGLLPASHAAGKEEQPIQDEKMFQRLLTDYHLLARLLIHQQRFPEGILLLKTVYEQSFRPPAVAQELCDAMDKAGRTTETIGILKEQIKLNPLNLSWAKRLADACEASKKWEEALQLRLELKKNYPENLENLMKLAAIYRQLQKNDEADKLVEKVALTARDKLFLFEKPPSSYRNPGQDKQDAEGLAALELQRQLGLQQDFEQYAAAFLLRQKNRQSFETVFKWLQEKPPEGYVKSVFPEQYTVGLWLAGREKEAVEILEKKFPAAQYPGADHLLLGYYRREKLDEKIHARFGEELPDYLNDNKPAEAPPKQIGNEEIEGEMASP